MNIRDIMLLAPVIPVLVIDELSQALPLAEVLVAGGLPVLEVTLRTPVAIEAIGLVSTIPGAVVGAGTVVNPADLDRSMEAGARFIVSPGITDELGKAAVASEVPFLPGVATASDIMRGLGHGFSHFKFFPAAAAGGIPALKALLGPFSGISICPTGGITPSSAPDWLVIPQVLCVGGSWMIQDGSASPAMVTGAAGLSARTQTATAASPSL